MLLFLLILSQPLVAAWSVMLLIGVIHAQVLENVNPVGYGTSLIIAFLLWVMYLFTLPARGGQCQ